MLKPELRRDFLRVSAMGATALIWTGALEATPECDDADHQPTEDNIEGPFYKAGAPERTVLAEKGMPGVPLVVAGRIITTDCEPLAYAILDVWHCDSAGVYDNQGYTLRGKIQADKNGRYELRTIVPPPYKVSEKSWRPAHIHVKVHAKGTPLLTTQMYFEGDRYNAVDSAYRKSLEISPTVSPRGGKVARFDFRLKRAG